MTTQEYYNRNADIFFKETVNLNMEDIYKPFLELVPKGGKILDAGCGSGRDTLYFIEKGYDVVAFDYSEPLVQLASEYTNQEILHMSFEDIDFIEEFDGIWACASLIHVAKRDINSAIARLERALKPNGVLYASFKYGDSEGYNKQRFFNNYTKSSFKSLVEDFTSLKVVHIWRTEDLRDERKDEFWLNTLLKKIEMQKLKTWAGRSEFKYTGSVDDGH